jgi:hypothetical protein
VNKEDVDIIKAAIETTKKFKTNAILDRIKTLQEKKGLSLAEIKEIDVLQDMLENIYIKAEPSRFDKK